MFPLLPRDRWFVVLLGTVLFQCCFHGDRTVAQEIDDRFIDGTIASWVTLY